MKTVYLRPIKIIKTVETVEEQKPITINAENDPFADWDEGNAASSEEYSSFSEGYYDNDSNEVQVEHKNTDGLRAYRFDASYSYSLKAARMSKEIKTPFAIQKTSKKGKGIGEFDNLYRTDQKIKYNEYKQGVTIGFVRASNKFKYAQYKPSMNEKLVGIINDEIPIRKEKGFNQKRVGYIKLAEGNSEENYYVEVTKNRGFWRLIQVVIIVAALLIVLNSINFENIHFSKDGLEFIKSAVTEMQEEKQLTISHLSDLRVKDRLVNIGLTSEISEGLEFKVKIYLGDNTDTGLLVCESERLVAGSSLDTIEISQQVMEQLRQGAHEGILLCEIYDNSDKSVRTVSSSIRLMV